MNLFKDDESDLTSEVMRRMFESAPKDGTAVNIKLKTEKENTRLRVYISKWSKANGYKARVRTIGGKVYFALLSE
jgi:hypothetical protein